MALFVLTIAAALCDSPHFIYGTQSPKFMGPPMVLPDLNFLVIPYTIEAMVKSESADGAL